MNGIENRPAYQLGTDEKALPVMIYTATMAVWGDVIVKEMIRISTWLRTNNCPDNLHLYNARLMMTSGVPQKPVLFPEMILTTTQVMAYHLIPPAQDPLDYDPTEPNRKMEPVTAVIGSFRFDGFIRMATMSTLPRYMEVNREMFTALYNTDISNMVLPQLGVIKVPFLMARQAYALFATRNA